MADSDIMSNCCKLSSPSMTVTVKCCKQSRALQCYRQHATFALLWQYLWCVEKN